MDEQSRGYPYFIQAYGKAAWSASDSNPTSLQSVLNGEPNARHELDRGLYAARWQRATPSGRKYLAAMAAINGDKPCGTADVAEYLGKETKETSAIRDALMKLGLIYPPEKGRIGFTVPGMGEFILRTMPGESQAYDGRKGNMSDGIRF